MNPVKTMSLKILSLIVVPFVFGCSSEIQGGTETGTANPGTADTDARIEAAASALVPLITTSEADSLTAALTYGTTDQWSYYETDQGSVYLEEIFGDPNQGFAVVTKIRVLVDQFVGELEGIFNEDPNLDCTRATPLNEGDQIEVAFYGSLPNGNADDRFFDCLHEAEEETIVYGRDAEGTVRIVLMSDTTQANTASTETRGDTSHILAVTYATYGETTEGEETAGYLDLQFSHAGPYNGADLTFGTDDDVVFKSRSRITGRVVLDDSGEPTEAAGDFAVTRRDDGPNNPGEESQTRITQILGRGRYGANDYSLFNVEHTADSHPDLVAASGLYCIQFPETEGDIPVNSDPANCSLLETAFAWGEASFPFDPLPALVSNFEERAFFEADETDMIQNDGDNFLIPTYD